MFSWDAQKALKNFEKHGVTFEEASTTFADDEALEWENLEHLGAEERWTLLGMSALGRILFVVYAPREAEHGRETVRIISARQATRKERNVYARQSTRLD